MKKTLLYSSVSFAVFIVVALIAVLSSPIDFTPKK